MKRIIRNESKNGAGGLSHLTARNLKQLGEQIRRVRRTKEMTQGQLAESAGLRQATISDIENGTRSNAASLFNVLAALGMEIHLLSIPPVANKRNEKSEN